MRFPVFPAVDLTEAAAAILKQSHYREVRKVTVEMEETGRLRLRGVVSSYYFKQLAQEIVRPLVVAEGLRLHNEIQVANDRGIVKCADPVCSPWS